MFLNLNGVTMRKVLFVLCMLFISSQSYAEEFDPAGLMCKQNGPRKAVWINTSHGTYALNGQAMSWFNETKKIGAPLLGTEDG